MMKAVGFVEIPGDDGIAALAPALHRLSTGDGGGGVSRSTTTAGGLRMLNLAHNWLYARAAMLLADGLRDAFDLHELDLSGTSIYNLQHSPSLSLLDRRNQPPKRRDNNSARFCLSVVV
jgi:hypothetical protein